jgi:flagellar biosynthesis protein FliR
MVVFSQLQLEAWLAGFLLPFFRLLALFASAPVLSHRSFPVRAKVGTAALIAMVAAPAIDLPTNLTLSSAAGLGLIAQQLVIGAALGFAARLVFAVLEIAGEFIGLQMGFSFAGFFNPSGRTESAVGAWLNTLGLMLFVALNAHLLLIDILVDTFRVFPITDQPLAALASLRVEQLGSEMFRFALALALPFTVLMLFVNLTLGFVSRIAPQLSIFAVGFPVTLSAGLVVLALSTTAMLTSFDQALLSFLAPFR